MFCNASCSNKIWINDVLWAYLSFYQDNCNLLISNCFELLCNVCYWKFLLIVSVVSLHHQALISCGAKCYFSKLGYQLFLVVFMKKIENQTISFCFFLILGPWNVALFWEWLVKAEVTHHLSLDAPRKAFESVHTPRVWPITRQILKKTIIKELERH